MANSIKVKINLYLHKESILICIPKCTEDIFRTLLSPIYQILCYSFNKPNSNDYKSIHSQ